MDNFIIEATKTTPFVRLSPTEGIFEIKGKSHSEDSLNFFRRIIDQLNQYNSSQSSLTADIFLEYFNTSSAKCLFDVTRALEKIQDKGYDVIVNWYHEEDDIDMVEIGEDYADLSDVKFNFIGVSEDEMEEQLDKLEVHYDYKPTSTSKFMRIPFGKSTR
jgi:hypothetical protein